MESQTTNKIANLIQINKIHHDTTFPTTSHDDFARSPTIDNTLPFIFAISSNILLQIFIHFIVI